MHDQVFRFFEEHASLTKKSKVYLKHGKVHRTQDQNFQNFW